VGVDHVEVAPVDRDVHRFTDGSTRAVHRRRWVGQHHQVLEVDERGVPATLIQVRHER